MYYGYARVSSKEQNLERQIEALCNFGVEKEKIYFDKQSGKDFNRSAYKKLLKVAKKDDIIVVKSIDRLGRNYEEIQSQWWKITKELMIDVVVIDMPLLDTRNKEGGLTGEFISDLVLQILSYVAELEHTSIKQRQAEGIAIAKAKGVKFGRPEKEVPELFYEAKSAYLRQELSSWQACKMCNIPYTTFLRWIRTKDINKNNLVHKVDFYV